MRGLHARVIPASVPQRISVRPVFTQTTELHLFGFCFSKLCFDLCHIALFSVVLQICRPAYFDCNLHFQSFTVVVRIPALQGAVVLGIWEMHHILPHSYLILEEDLPSSFKLCEMGDAYYQILLCKLVK